MEKIHFVASMIVAGICAPISEAAAHSIGKKGIDPLTPPMVSHLLDVEQYGADYGKDGYGIRGVIDTFAYWNGYSLLTGCFVSQDKQKRAAFMAISNKWSSITGTTLRLDFGSPPNYRDCSGSGKEHVRVAFRSTSSSNGKQYHWSYLGSKSVSNDDNGASLNINPDLIENDTDFRVAVLHELGHALGLEGEHRHPDSNCYGKIFWPSAYAVYANLPKQTVKAMFSILVGEPGQYDKTGYDQKSIMHYEMPWQMFGVDGKTSGCWVEKNTSLSPGDMNIIRKYYGSGGRPIAALQARADRASAALATTSLSYGQKVTFAKALFTTMRRGKKTGGKPVSVRFALGPTKGGTANLRKSGPDSKTDCVPMENKGTKASCALSGDGMQLEIVLD